MFIRDCYDKIPAYISNTPLYGKLFRMPFVNRADNRQLFDMQKYGFDKL